MDKTITSIDEYIAGCALEVQEILTTLRTVIQETAPEATEKISWGMATFSLHGNLVHFSAQKNHTGFYPAPSAIVAFQDELSMYHCSKGAVQFPYSKPLPLDLIRRMVQFRVTEQMALAEAKKTRPL